MNNFLYGEEPIVVTRELAKSIGLNEAIVLQQLHYWININKKANRHFHNGKYWTYNTIPEWHKTNFTFWSVDTVKRAFKSLTDKGLIIKDNFNQDKRNRRLWYSIDYKKLNGLTNSEDQTVLLGEYPLVTSKELAQTIGLNEAIVLQQLNYWITSNKKRGTHFYKSRYWTYNSIEKWHKTNFDFWGYSTVERIFTSLVKKGILIKDNFNKDKRDRTIWYSINYAHLETLINSIPSKCPDAKGEKSPDAKVQNEGMTKGQNGGMEGVQNEGLQKSKMRQPLPETSPEISSKTSTDTNNNNNKGNGFSEKRDKPNAKKNVVVEDEILNELKISIDSITGGDIVVRELEAMLSKSEGEAMVRHALEHYETIASEILKTKDISNPAGLFMYIAKNRTSPPKSQKSTGEGYVKQLDFNNYEQHPPLTEEQIEALYENFDEIE